MSKQNRLPEYLTKIEERLRTYSTQPIILSTYYTVLAIDPGTTNLSYSLQHPNADTTRKIKAPDLPVALQVAYLYEALLSVIHDCRYSFNVELIVKEDTARSQVFRASDMGRVAQMIDSLGLQLNIPVVTINPATLRSFLGSKSKSDTKLVVYKRWGREFSSEDEADAYALGQAGVARVRGQLLLGREKKAAKRKAKREAA